MIKRELIEAMAELPDNATIFIENDSGAAALPGGLLIGDQAVTRQGGRINMSPYEIIVRSTANTQGPKGYPAPRGASSMTRKKLMFLADERTFSGLNGCQIVSVPADWDTEHIEDARRGDTEDWEQLIVLRTFTEENAD